MGKKVLISAVLAIVILGAGALVWYYQFREPPVEPDDPDITMHPVEKPDDPVDVTELDPLREHLEREPEDPVEPREPEELPDDEVITDRFIRDLASLIFRNYHPAVSPAEEGGFTLSFRELNMHYATELTGLSYEEQDVLQAREEVLGHLLQPEVIDLVVRRYGPELFDRLVHLAETEPREVHTSQGLQERQLENRETVEMLEIVAQRLEHLAHVFSRTSSEEPVLERMRDYLDTVEELNSVYFEYWQLDESDDERRSELASRIKQLIMQRENIRGKIVDRVSTPQIAEAGLDVLYQVQWIFRRVEKGGFSRDSIQAMAEAGEDLASMARDRADELVQE